MLAPGSVALAEAETSCPACGKTMNFNVRLTVENLVTISMILWTHENPIVCAFCKSQFVPSIERFNPNALTWGLNPVEDKPLISRQNIVDVAGNPIKLN